MEPERLVDVGRPARVATDARVVAVDVEEGLAFVGKFTSSALNCKGCFRGDPLAVRSMGASDLGAICTIYQPEIVKDTRWPPGYNNPQ